MPLTEQAQAMLNLAYRPGAPRFYELSVEDGRRALDKTMFVFGSHDQPRRVFVQDVCMARGDGSLLPARLYKPMDSEHSGPCPLIVFFHGGGWCIGNVACYDTLCQSLTEQSGCALLSVDYRLAPEYPFPAAVDDAQEALGWIRQHASAYGVSAEHIALAGDSAGGALALTTALALRDSGKAQVRFLCLIYPSVQIRSSRPSRQRYAEGYFLDNGSLEWFFSKYLPHGGEDDWRASPLLAGSLADLPPTLVITAEYDPLSDDSIALVERMRLEGGFAEHISIEGMIHAFLPLDKFYPEAAAVQTRIAGALRTALAADR